MKNNSYLIIMINRLGALYTYCTKRSKSSTPKSSTNKEKERKHIQLNKEWDEQFQQVYTKEFHK